MYNADDAAQTGMVEAVVQRGQPRARPERNQDSVLFYGYHIYNIHTDFSLRSLLGHRGEQNRDEILISGSGDIIGHITEANA